MTSVYLPQFIPALLALMATLFLVIRLRFFADRLAGRVPFITGGCLISAGLAWQVLKGLPGYQEWFLSWVYSWLNVGLYAALIVGMVLAVVGLAMAYESRRDQQERTSLKERHRGISLLARLQQEARRPYQLLELLDITVKQVTEALPETSGVVFLLNRSRRQFVLAAAVGLTQEETASLEHYPLDRNIIGEALELGGPLVGGGFQLIERDGTAKGSRFASCLVLPLLSGSDRIGGLVLLAERQQAYSRADITHLYPIAEWLSEKIRSARLAKELSSVRRQLDQDKARQSETRSRVLTAVTALSASDPTTALCHALVGLASCGSAHLCGIVGGTLQFYGGSEPLADLRESYRTALTEALDRNKPLIINQEAAGDDNRSYVALSTLVYPIRRSTGVDALILRKDGGPFSVTEADLKLLEVVAGMARLALLRDETDRQAVTRRKGFSRILSLLRFDPSTLTGEDIGGFARQFASTLPEGAVSAAFRKQLDGLLRVETVYGCQHDLLAELEVKPREGIMGEVVMSGTPRFAYGRENVQAVLDRFDTRNRDAFLRILAGRERSSLMAICPVFSGRDLSGVIVAFLFGVAEDERREWERLMTLTAGIGTLRQTVGALYAEPSGTPAGKVLPVSLGAAVNRFNNHLSAIVGNADLAAGQANTSEAVRGYLKNVISQAEQAAACVKESFGKEALESGLRPDGAVPSPVTLNEVLKETLQRVHVSGRLYMIGGHPREVLASHEATPPVAVPRDLLGRMSEELLDRFAAGANEDDVITLAVYRRGDAVYLDISRHRRDFPPIDRVAGFGDYLSVEEALHLRPDDSYLKFLAGRGVACCADRHAAVPAYASFRFPLADYQAEQEDARAPRPAVRILAIDDQAVIRDLIAAMCQSLGYEAITASRGEEGIKLAEETTFDAILVDLAMPDMSGLEVSRRIRQVRTDVPIVLVTGWQGHVGPGELEASGIDRVLYKPFRIEQLTDIVQTSVSSRPT